MHISIANHQVDNRTKRNALIIFYLLETVDNISNNCRPFSHSPRLVAQDPCAVRHCFYHRSGLDVMTDKSKDLAALFIPHRA